MDCDVTHKQSCVAISSLVSTHDELWKPHSVTPRPIVTVANPGVTHLVTPSPNVTAANPGVTQSHQVLS